MNNVNAGSQIGIPAFRSSRRPRVGHPSALISGVFEVPLTRGKIALIDEIDFLAVSRWSWLAASDRSGGWHARANILNSEGTRSFCYLHDYLMSPPDGFEVDHVDRDGLNNRRSNLRVASHQENCWNTGPRPGTSRFKGVCWESRRGRWRATITVDGRQESLGEFDSEIEAASAYDVAAIRCFGEFAQTNASLFPEIIPMIFGEDELRAIRFRSKRLPAGEAHFATNLTIEKVCEMRRRFDAGEATKSQLAREYNIDPTTAARIVMRKSWKHVI